ncbi:hypothetical protein TALC_00904 [Thermoplasmatales archaeon BRNA1]|nr:hypothetical protein TALC_00904 [Thermoplasmatales archaeon BRNA1]
MYIRWHGLSCFEFYDGRTRVVTDPHDGKSIGLYTPNVYADVVLSTHNSFARNCFRIVKGTHRDFLEYAGDGSVGDFSFLGLQSGSLHGSDGNQGANSIYSFSMDGIRVAFTGSLGGIPDDFAVECLRDSDILFVPVGAYSTISIDGVNEFIDMVRPKVVVPTDFKIGGVTLPLAPIQEFMEGKDPDSFVHVGNEVEFYSEDIADYEGIWLFD